MAEKIRRTKGTFKVAGFANGAERNKFIFEKTFDSGRTKKTCSFGVRTSEKNETWIIAGGFDSEKAVFTKWENKESFKKKVAWEDRFSFKEENYKPSFSTAIAIIEDKEGKLNYDNFFQFDAVEELETGLSDGMPLYIEGDINYSSWENKKNEIERRKEFSPRKIRKSSKKIDFSSNNFKEINYFEQEFIFINIAPHPEKAGRFILESKIVSISKNEPTIEDVEFFIDDKSLVTTLKKNLKPYYAITVFGRIINSVEIEKINTEDEVWGKDEAQYNAATIPIDKHMIITKAYASTVDKDSFTEEMIENIQKVDKSFGNKEWKDDEKSNNEDVWKD